MQRLIAITGAVGAGKSRLTDKLQREFGFSVPAHITTRKPRRDDVCGFYKYVTLAEFNRFVNSDSFLFHSGDGIRHYGILHEAAEQLWGKGQILLVNCSLKDIAQVTALKVQKVILVLTFRELSLGIRTATEHRVWSDEELASRIKECYKDHQLYEHDINRFSTAKIFADEVSFENLFQKSVDTLIRVFGTL